MKFNNTDVGVTVEILASKDFQAIPATITGEAVVKAGTPITEAGAAALDGTGAVGILLYDVDPAVNPNAAVVVSGIVDWAKCKKHAGATATAEAMKAVLPGITFRENIGVNTESV